LSQYAAIKHSGLQMLPVSTVEENKEKRSGHVENKEVEVIIIIIIITDIFKVA